jgi:hypothetical protein
MVRKFIDPNFICFNFIIYPFLILYSFQAFKKMYILFNKKKSFYYKLIVINSQVFMNLIKEIIFYKN